MSANSPVYLGIDLGAESGRVMAGIWNGQTIELQECHRFPNGPVRMNGSLRWNITGLWAGIQEGLKRAAQTYGDRIRSIGVDSWGVDYVLLNSEHQLLGQPYCYRDPRTEGIEKRLFERVAKEEIFAQSGTQFMEINSLYQLFAMAEQQPATMAQAAHFMMIGDFVNYLLTDQVCAEYTNATTTQFLNPVTKDWSTALLDSLGIPSAILPKIVQPGARLGNTSKDVSVATGLPELPVIVPPTHDTASAVVATPSRHTGSANWAYISSGTWSLMGVELQEAALGQNVLELNMTNEGGVDGTFRLLKNIMGLWLVQKCKRDFEKVGSRLDYSQLATLAQDAEPFRSLIPVNDNRFLRPDSMTESIRESCAASNQPAPETEGQFIRCCLESLAFAYRETLEKIQTISGEKVEVIHVMGGGSKNALLNQFTANACGIPILAGPVEATVMGNLLMQVRVDGGLSSLSEIREASAASSEIQTFEPEASDHWQEQYERWLALHA